MDASPLLKAICDADNALRLGFCLTLDDVTEEVFRGLVMLAEERDRKQQRDASMATAREKARTIPL